MSEHPKVPYVDWAGTDAVILRRRQADPTRELIAQWREYAHFLDRQSDDAAAATRKCADELETLAERSHPQEAPMDAESAALSRWFEAYQSLKRLGWNDIIYCPKDGSHFDAIEVGSTGIHDCNYEGKWPDGYWWVYDGDIYPSLPALFRERNRHGTDTAKIATPPTPPAVAREEQDYLSGWSEREAIAALLSDRDEVGTYAKVEGVLAENERLRTERDNAFAEIEADKLRKTALQDSIDGCAQRVARLSGDLSALRSALSGVIAQLAQGVDSGDWVLIWDALATLKRLQGEKS